MGEPFKHNTKRQLTCFSENPSLISGLTTRQGGVSGSPFDSLNMGLHVNDRDEDVIANRRLIADEVGIPLERWVMGEQVHGIQVKRVDKEDLGKGTLSLDTAVSGVDGLITNQKDVLLTAFYADCVPLYFMEPTSGWIGIAHAGWKGTVHGMAKAMIDQMVVEGASLDRLKMAVGPCIGRNHYEVDEHVMNHIPPEWRDEVLTPVDDSHAMLDLKALNTSLALQAGLRKENVQASRICTYEEERLLYSHRRDQGKTGRMLGFIGWKS
ncbi:peptidoglycan editing factor PgeF [Halobacillus litoralis]|uniref:peptidoglycan editing factor PgeF n=1 Tax=Halobacillus litoralis TaxID=45668 RepID=UPI001CD51B28|nr:peptidoglycan editing factor PgeF [Halobacillus litoralis]MCA0969356.1 peptidoglycan editing factor PgeF [Halobacillus litoralis]